MEINYKQMKKLSLILLVGVFLAGCSKINLNHEVKENGGLQFTVKIEENIPIIEEMKEELLSEKEMDKYTETECKEKTYYFDDDIKNKKCEGEFIINKEETEATHITTISGEYKISDKNFSKKDGYILFNAKEVKNNFNKISGGTMPMDVEHRLKSGNINVFYEIFLPGEPINYKQGQKMNLLKMKPNKNYFFVSKIGGEENPFKDKMTEENKQNLLELTDFSSDKSSNEDEMSPQKAKEVFDKISKEGQLNARNAQKRSHVQNVSTIVKVSLANDKNPNYDLSIPDLEGMMKSQGYDLFVKGDFAYAVKNDGKEFAVYACLERTKELTIAGTSNAIDIVKSKNPCNSQVTPLDPSDEKIAGYKVFKIKKDSPQENIMEIKTHDDSLHSSGKALVSTGSKSIIGNIIDSIVNFFKDLF